MLRSDPKLQAAMTTRRRLFTVAATLVAVLAVCSCQKRGEPVPTLTQDQWRRVQENLLTEEPTPANVVNAVFDDRVRLIGWDLEPGSLEVGDTGTMTFYWEVLEDFDERWRIYVHMDSASRQNVDHEAVGGGYPSVYWEKGQFIRDACTVEFSPGLGDGDVRLFAGLFKGDDRMRVSDPGAGTVEDDGRLNIGSFPLVWEPPVLEATWRRDDVSMDGRVVDRAWGRARQTASWVHPVSGEDIDGGDTWAKALWDDEALYLGLRARDTDVWSNFTDRDANLWEEEVLEVYLDPGADGRNYLELQVNPNNAVFDALFVATQRPHFREARLHTVEGMQTEVSVRGTLNQRDDRDVYWSLEMRIPWGSLPGFDGPPANGAEIRANFYRYDRPADGTITTWAWSAVGSGSFHKPEKFGIIRLTGRPADEPSADGAAADDDDDDEARRGMRRPVNSPQQLRRGPR